MIRDRRRLQSAQRPQRLLKCLCDISRVFSAVSAVSALFVLGVVGHAQAPGDGANGKRLFEKDGCYECHGHAGQGGRDGARLAATPLTSQAFVRYIRRPSGAMPAYTQKVMSDQEVLDVYAYVKAMPSAKPIADIPLLNHLRDK